MGSNMQHATDYRGEPGCFIPNTPIKQRGASAENSGDMGGVEPVETNAEKASIMTPSGSSGSGCSGLPKASVNEVRLRSARSSIEPPVSH